MTGHSLTKAELAMILQVFSHHAEIERVMLFGSRAKGTAKNNSDIDLAVCGNGDAVWIQALLSELDELPLPYKFDVVLFDDNLHAPLREHIERVGVTIFGKMPD